LMKFGPVFKQDRALLSLGKEMEVTKILIAEDNPDILTIMADRLKSEGYDVITATDGEMAWDQITRLDPDIILLDLMMPNMRF